MRKLLIICPLLIAIISLSGCLGEIFGSTEAQLYGDWSKDGNSNYRIRFQKNGEGVALNQNSEDYTFSWRLDPDRNDIMYWEIEGVSTRVIHYYLLKEGELLVLEWDGMPSAFMRE